MIQANELRIGNIFRDKYTKDYFKVLELSKNKIVFDYCTEEPWQAEPVPLTEEILLKCGFKNEHDEIDGVYYDIYYNSVNTLTSFVIEYKIRNNGYYLVSENGEIMSCKILYLHQLQNLYFALTNKELEIEL